LSGAVWAAANFKQASGQTMVATGCSTTKTKDAPLCPPGVTSYWAATATCATPPCTDVDWGPTPVSGCKLAPGDVEATSVPPNQVDAVTPPGCIGVTYNCDCAPATSPIYITVTSSATATDPPLKVFEYGTAQNTWITKGDQLCELGAGESCHVTTNFGVTRGQVGSGSVFTNNEQADTALTGTCPFGADVSVFPKHNCGVPP
jgi:hypothetical protein